MLNYKKNIMNNSRIKTGFRLSMVRRPKIPMGMRTMFYFTLNGMVMPIRSFQ